MLPIGVLNVERIVLVGSAAEFGEPWLTAVRETMEASAFGLLANDTTIEIGGSAKTVSCLGLRPC